MIESNRVPRGGLSDESYFVGSRRMGPTVTLAAKCRYIDWFHPSSPMTSSMRDYGSAHEATVCEVVWHRYAAPHLLGLTDPPIQLFSQGVPQKSESARSESLIHNKSQPRPGTGPRRGPPPRAFRLLLGARFRRQALVPWPPGGLRHDP
jgi:hypothetical protein